jgi:hypothetical protein
VLASCTAGRILGPHAARSKVIDGRSGCVDADLPRHDANEGGGIGEPRICDVAAAIAFAANNATGA